MSALGNSLTKSYPAEPASVPSVRQEIAELALAAGGSPEQVEAIKLAVSEAVTNVVVHAYRWRPGRIYVTAAAVSDELWVLIGDNGCGMNARSNTPGLGLGLVLISQECDGFTVVTRGTGGTEVRMRFDLVAIDDTADGQARGSDAAAARPASARFSTTT
jgi:anti-sigma regulatory factor (Ser/Thr protein kinase)